MAEPLHIEGLSPAREGSDHRATLARVEDYFDRTATQSWDRLTSDAKVSGIRATVREGRDRMRLAMLAELPEALGGQRVLDAGCGTGTAALALHGRGADVTAVDISPRLIEIAKARHGTAIDWRAGDLTSAALGTFDHVFAMDSLIYYDRSVLAQMLAGLSRRTRGQVLFTVAPRTPLLMLMWRAGRLFPRADRSPVMVPHSADGIASALRDAGCRAPLREVTRITSGFYISSLFALGGQAA